MWAYYEPVSILISGTGRPRKTMISKTLDGHFKGNAVVSANIQPINCLPEALTEVVCPE